MLLSAGLSLLLYREVRIVARDLVSAEPTGAGEIFPWIPRLGIEALRQPDGAVELRYLGLLLGLFLLYGIALRVVADRRSPALAAAVGAAGAAYLMLQLSGPAMLSSDVYSYVMYGRISAIYGGDPYSVLPHYHSDPYEPLSYWKTDPSFYGPLWTLLSGWLASLGGERVGLTALLFRSTAAGAALAAGALIWGSLRVLAPHRAAQGLMFFLWNPLLVLESGLSGHNDSVMAALLLLGVWLHLRGRAAWAVAALTLSGLVKIVAFAILPLYVLMVLRRRSGWPARARFLAPSAAAALLSVAVVLGASRSGPGVLAVSALGSGAGRYLNSVHELALERLRLGLGEEPQSVRVAPDFQRYWVQVIRPTELWSDIRPEAGRQARIERDAILLVLAPQDDDWIWVYTGASGRKGYVLNRDARKIGPPPIDGSDRVLAALAEGPAEDPIRQQANAIIRAVTWGAFAAFWLLAAWRAATVRAFLIWSTAVLLALYWLVAAWFWPWYVVWALALAALVPGTRAARLTLLLSGTALGLYAWLGYQDSSERWLYTYRSLLIFVPPLLSVLVGLAMTHLTRAVRTPVPRRRLPMRGPRAVHG